MQSPFQSIPSYLLPSILSYIPIPHLQYRLVSKEWDVSMKTAHTLGLCQECEVQCPSADKLLLRMQQLTRKQDEITLPWPLNWMFVFESKNPSWNTDFRPHLQHLESDLIPGLDSLYPSSSMYSITLDMTSAMMPQPTAAMIADWCLEHSKPAKYTFFVSFNWTSFAMNEHLSSFLRSPGMSHVNRLGLDSLPHEYSLSPLCDSHTVSNLKSLRLQNCSFRSQDAEYLARSLLLTNLTQLTLFELSGLDGMAGKDRTAGFDTIICAPIMKNVRSFKIANFDQDFEYSIVDAFAQSKHLRNLTHLTLSRRSRSKEWPLDALLRCDATMPVLKSFEVHDWYTGVSEAAMSVITSPTSVLFNRLESLKFSDSAISVASMAVLCSTDGLRTLNRLILNRTNLTDEGMGLLSSSPYFRNLHYLGVYQNSRITNKSVIALYSSKNLQSLQHIDFSRCYTLREDAVRAEIDVLPPRPNLRWLEFRPSNSQN